MAFSLLSIICGFSEHNRFKAATDAAVSALQIREYRPYKNAFNENPGVTLLKCTQWFVAPQCCFSVLWKTIRQGCFCDRLFELCQLPFTIGLDVDRKKTKTYSMCHLHKNKPKLFVDFEFICVKNNHQRPHLWVSVAFSLSDTHTCVLTQMHRGCGFFFSFSCSCLASSCLH